MLSSMCNKLIYVMTVVRFESAKQPAGNDIDTQLCNSIVRLMMLPVTAICIPFTSAAVLDK